MYFPQNDLMRQHYTATPSGYSMSSGVSTPSMTPPFAPVMESMVSHYPSWMHHEAGSSPLLMQVQQLQNQTFQLAQMIKEQQQSHQRFVPMYMTPPSPAPPVAMGGSYAEAVHAAQTVLSAVPANQQLEESVLAKAVVAAANALLAGRSGHIAALRVPTAVRPVDPDNSLLVFANYKAESPAPSDRGSKCNSPVFGLEPKSPGTVTKCARQDE